jgi:hypothetical protein
MQTYVYNGKEVCLTGRKAVKRNSRRSNMGSDKIVYEIKQIKYKDDEPSEWVEMRELYVIMDKDNEQLEDIIV